MTSEKNSGVYRKILLAISRYLLFFLVVAFVITCCMTLFVSVMAKTLNITPTRENISMAAKLTFINVIIFSLIFTVIDALRRKFTLNRPVKKITDAAQMIIEGDFSVRIPKFHGAYDDSFDVISDCFNQMAEELSGTETLRTDFIANVSHELKTPLAVMQNYATMLQKSDLPEKTRIEYAKNISDASRKLANLITNILKLNKLENQQISPVCEVYDLSEQLCECLLNFEYEWEKKELDIDTDIEDGILIKTDREMMTLVWNNLFSNAIKFTDVKGKIALSLYADGDDAVVRISDTGCGISEEVGAHMFEKFYQGDTSRSTQGNGLGLALVKRVIDITNSDISVESELFKGTSFTVRIQREKNGEI